MLKRNISLNSVCTGDTGASIIDIKLSKLILKSFCQASSSSSCLNRRVSLEWLDQ